MFAGKGKHKSIISLLHRWSMAGRFSSEVVRLCLALFICTNVVHTQNETTTGNTTQPPTTTVDGSTTAEQTMLTTASNAINKDSSKSTDGTMTGVEVSTTAAAQPQTSTSSEMSTYLYIAIGVAAAELLIIVVLGVCLLRLTRCFRQKINVHDAHRTELQPAHGSLYRKHTNLPHDYCEIEIDKTKTENRPKKVPSTKLAQNGVNAPVHADIDVVYSTAGNMRNEVMNERNAGIHDATQPLENYSHLSVYSVAKSEPEGNRLSMASTETTDTMVSETDPRQIYFILEADPANGDQHGVILLSRSIKQTKHSPETTSHDQSDTVTKSIPSLAAWASAHAASDGTDFETKPSKCDNSDLEAKDSMRRSQPVLGFSINRSGLRRHSSSVYENVERPIYGNASDLFPRHASSRARRLPAKTIGSLPDLVGLPVHEKHIVYGNVSKPAGAAGDVMGHEDPYHGHGKRKMHVPSGKEAPTGKVNDGQNGSNGVAPNTETNHEGPHTTYDVLSDSDRLKPMHEHGGGHRVDKHKRQKKPRGPKGPAPNKGPAPKKEVVDEGAREAPRPHHEQHELPHKQERAYKDEHGHKEAQHPISAIPVNPRVHEAVGRVNSTGGCMHDGVKELESDDEQNMTDKIVYKNTGEPVTQKSDLRNAKLPPHPQTSDSSVSEPTERPDAATGVGTKDTRPNAGRPDSDTKMDQCLGMEEGVQNVSVHDYENVDMDDDDAIYANSLSVFIA